MTVDDLERELAEGRLRPAYLLAGEEIRLFDTALRLLRGAVLAGAPEAFDQSRLEGEKTSPAELRDALRTLPAAAPRRLVWLRLAGPMRGRTAALLEALPELLGELATGDTAILVVTTARADRRTAWAKAFGNPSARVDCAPPRERGALLAFLQREAAARSVRLEAAAARHLIDRVGPHLQQLCNELEKAVLLVAPKQRIGEAQVRAATADLAEKPVWDLTDALGEGRAGDALAVLVRLDEAGTPPPLVLGALASHFRKLLRLRSGASVSGAAFALRKLRKQAARYECAELRACLAAIGDADLAIKGATRTGGVVVGGGGQRPSLALEQLALRLAAPGLN